MKRSLLKRALAGTTALIGITFLQPALAQIITINNATTTPVTLSNGDGLRVTSTGSITNVGNAVLVAPGEHAGGIVNEGTIDGNSAIRIYTASLTGGFTNSGNVTGGFISLSQSEISGGINNSGTIDSISIFSTHMHGDTLNTGNITARLAFGSSDIQGNIVNAGFVDQLYVANDPLEPRIAMTGSITNQAGGTINDLLEYNMRISGAIHNENGATIGTLGVYSNADIAGGVVNDGSITQLDVSSTAVLSGRVLNNSTGDIRLLTVGRANIGGGVVNYGNIGSIIVGSSGADISGGIRNMGTLGDGVNSAIEIGATSAFSGAIYNSGIIDSGGNNAIVLQQLTRRQDITLDGGRIIGNIFDDNIANGFSNVIVKSNFKTEGDFDVSELHINPGAALTIGAGHEVTLDHMGQFGGGALGFEVSDSIASGLLRVVNGAVNLTQNTIFAVEAAGATLTDGMETIIADGTSRIVGGPGGTWKQIKDNSLLWNFFIGDGTVATGGTDDTDIYLRVATGDPLVDSSNAQTRGLAEMLKGLGSPSDPDLQQVQSNIAAATTTDQVSAILNSLVPTVDGAAQRSAQMFAEQSLDLTSDHLVSLEDAGTGLSSGNALAGLGTWGQVFGQAARQGAQSTVAGYDAQTGGFALGAETQSLLDSTLGVALSYGHTNVDSHNANDTSGDIDSYQLAFYGQHDFARRTYLRGMAAYAYNSNEVDRHNVGGPGGPTASGDFSADQYALRLETGRHYSLGHAVLTPDLVANWMHYAPESYTETGAGGLNLHIRGESADIAELGAGLKLKWGYQHTDGARVIPEVHAGYRYDLIGDAVETTAAFTGGGAAFSSTGASPGRNRVNLGAGLTYATTASWDFSAGYDLDLKESYLAHSGTLRATFKF